MFLKDYIDLSGDVEISFITRIAADACAENVSFLVFVFVFPASLEVASTVQFFSSMNAGNTDGY